MEITESHILKALILLSDHKYLGHKLQFRQCRFLWTLFRIKIPIIHRRLKIPDEFLEIRENNIINCIKKLIKSCLLIATLRMKINAPSELSLNNLDYK